MPPREHVEDDNVGKTLTGVQIRLRQEPAEGPSQQGSTTLMVQMTLQISTARNVQIPTTAARWKIWSAVLPPPGSSRAALASLAPPLPSPEAPPLLTWALGH